MKKRFKKLKQKIDYLYFDMTVVFLLLIVILANGYYAVKKRIKKDE